MYIFNILCLIILVLFPFAFLFYQYSHLTIKSALICVVYPLFVPFLYIHCLLKWIIGYLSNYDKADEYNELIAITPILGYFFYSMFYSNVVYVAEHSVVDFTSLCSILIISFIAIILNIGFLTCFGTLVKFNNAVEWKTLIKRTL